MKTFVIGISGVTNGGKTTLAKNLQKHFPNCSVISQDDFFKPESEIETDENGFLQYDGPVAKGGTPKPRGPLLPKLQESALHQKHVAVFFTWLQGSPFWQSCVVFPFTWERGGPHPAKTTWLPLSPHQEGVLTLLKPRGSPLTWAVIPSCPRASRFQAVTQAFLLRSAAPSYILSPNYSLLPPAPNLATAI
ncbi:nicotinamide riboside kinase 1 isoform X4 [Artibeus jamaicensis]|uniref:nicotinamide riboside kinase 1 isoform X4 n=1 Tax=Artibeus jamaicensis TaxID=9417 RepID=UPI00235AC89D|nr:nicotinamide riboside kinase 1 isoform X4 [Artibeus jamaicensis]